MKKAIITKEQFNTFVVEIYNEYEKSFYNGASQDTFCYNIVTNHLVGGNIGFPDWTETDIFLCCFYPDGDTDERMLSWESILEQIKKNCIIFG